MSAFREKYPLPSKSMSAGGNAVIELGGLPDDCRLAGIMLSVLLTTTAASGTPAVTVKDILGLLATVDFDSDFFFMRATGKALWVLEKAMRGHKYDTAAASATGGVQMRANAWIPLQDPRSVSPNDTTIPSKLIRDKTLNIGFASSFAPTWDSIVVTCSAATLQATAYCVPDGGDLIPMKSRIAFEDWSQNTLNIKPGYFTDLMFTEEALALTLAEHLQYSLSLDGQPIVDRMPTAQLVDFWNREVCKDAGSELSYQPSASQAFIPILSAGQGYRAVQLPRAIESARIDIDAGSQTGGRVLYRQVLPTQSGEERDAIVKLGLNPQTVKIEAKTAKGNELQGSERRQARVKALLPKRLGR